MLGTEPVTKCQDGIELRPSALEYVAMSAGVRWYGLTFTAMNTTFRAAPPRSLYALTNSRETSGQISVQCESMKVRITVLPCRPASDTGWPDWSVSVKPGALVTGTGESCIMAASLVLTVFGMPVVLTGDRSPPDRLVTTKANTVAKATPDTSAMTPSTTVERLGLTSILVRRLPMRPAPVSLMPGGSLPGAY